MTEIVTASDPVFTKTVQNPTSFASDRPEGDRFNRRIPTDPLFVDQWHLRNTGQSRGTPGADANLQPAWDLALGTGVTIAIVDDGLEYDHPDLVDRYRADLSYDFNDNDPNPDPVFESHGTSVAGVAAATADNDIGVSGAAPGASIAGIRLTAGATTDAIEADALSYKNQDIDIYNNSWGPEDDAARLEGPGPLTLEALRNSVTTGRGGLGNIYVWAAGNGLQVGDNVNYDGYANSRYTIAVSAIDHNGKQSYYSEPGAPILVAAYSDSDEIGITTTDLTGGGGEDPDSDYTAAFGGTSSATPLVSGVIALMLEVNPALSWRDVQHILVNTAKMTDPLDSDWTTNGAGYAVNHKYGFGAIDAAAAVNAALNWTPVEAEVFSTSGAIALNAEIPDDDPLGLQSSFSVATDLTVEWVEVVVDATHEFRGDLALTLTSPEGTQSILSEVHSDPNPDIDNWTFTSARHWGESSLGDWTLTVADGGPDDVGTWNSWQLKLYGTGDRNLGGEANDTLARAIATNFGPANLNDYAIAGKIGDNPAVDPGLDVDLYAFEMSQGDVVALNVDVSGATPPDLFLRVFDADGTELADLEDGVLPGQGLGSNPDLLFTAPETGRYYVGLSSLANDAYNPLKAGSGITPGDTGDYTLSLRTFPVNEQGESNDVLTQAVASGLSSQNPGVFTVSGVIGNSPTLGSPDDVDFIQVQMGVGDRLTVDLDAAPFGSGLDSILRLFDAAGNELALNDDQAAPEETGSTDSYLDFTATLGGLYYIGVSSYANSAYDPFTPTSGVGSTAGPYSLDVELIPAVQPPMVPPGVPADGDILNPVPEPTPNPPANEGTPGADTITLTQGGVTVFGRGGNDTLDASGSSGNSRLFGNGGNDRLYASRRDRLFGNEGRDRLDASRGRGGNQLRGGNGNDTLRAGQGDRLFGDRGDDWLYGGRGGNVLTGGKGRDRFWLTDGALPRRPNLVRDFQVNQDKLGIGGIGASDDDLSFIQSGRRTILSLDGTTLAILQNVRADDLSARDVVFG